MTGSAERHPGDTLLIHGTKFECSNGIGIPQGGVCSAKFWLIAFNNAIKIINKFNIEGNGHADDCSAVLGGKRLDHIIINMEKPVKEADMVREGKYGNNMGRWRR